MRALKTSFRIVKFLWRAILGLLLILISAVAIVHIPAVQRQITHAVSDYLSSKIQAKVYIDRIEFSILGHVSLKELTIWSRDGNKIFSIDEIEVRSSIFDLVTGNLIFDQIRIVGLNGKLIQDEVGLNIQFILDAFRSEESTAVVESRPIKLRFKDVQLENSNFKFNSTRSGIEVANVIGVLHLSDAEYSTSPNIIRADKIYIQRTAVNILSTPRTDTVTVTLPSKIDSVFTSSGIVITVGDIKVEHSDFSFHQNEVMRTTKFDPSHIELNDLNTAISDIFVGVQKDTVAANLHSLSARLPGIKVEDASTSFQWSENRLSASDLHLASNKSELNVDFKGANVTGNSIGNELAQIEINASGRVNPQDLSYFISDSVMAHFTHWTTTDLTLEGHYNLGEGKIQTLTLKTENSQVQVSAIVGHVLNIDNIYWDDLAVNASIGPDFKTTLTPFLGNLDMPSGASLQLKSSGNSKKAFIDGRVISNWGDIKIDGTVNRQEHNIGIDLKLTGDEVNLGQWLKTSSLGTTDLSLRSTGLIGDDTNVEIDGLINNIEVMDQTVHNVDLQSEIEKSAATVNLQIDDPHYQSKIHSEMSFAGPLILTSDVSLNNFKLNDFASIDSTLLITGDLKSKITIAESSLEVFVKGDSIQLQNQSQKYLLDTIAFRTFLSSTNSEFEYHSEDEQAKLTANFDARNSPEFIRAQLDNILKGNPGSIRSSGEKTLLFDINLESAKLLQLLNIDVDDFSSLHVKGELDEQQKESVLQATSGKIRAYGISIDSLNTNIVVLRDSVGITMTAKNLIYNSVELGTLELATLTKQDTLFSNLLLSNDTIDILGLHTKILLTDSGALINPDKLLVLDNSYSIDPTNTIFINNKNVRVNHLRISRENMRMNVDGDLNAFNISLQNVDLTSLNFLLSSDTTIINNGHLSGNISYSPSNQHVNIDAKIDTLSLYNSSPLTIVASATSDGGKVPFKFLLTNTSNEVDLKGQFNFDTKEVDARLLLNVNNPELFSFLVSGAVDEMHGTIKGETKITGPIQKPIFKGYVQLLDAELTTVNPKLTFNVHDDRIILDNSALLFNNFTLYDSEHHPLTVDGNLKTTDYKTFSYDLKIHAEDYTLLNKPDSATGKLSGRLVLDSDIQLKGNEKDTNVEAKLTIKDNTSLTFVSSNDNIELLTAEGIVDFVDPTAALDSALDQSVSFYDSLIASFPEFNLNSTVRIEDDAKLRIVIDAQSGDYMETSGGATLDLSYDRGNLQLIGDYRIKQGVYRLSFYDLVKRNFTLVPNSSIHWNGNPENGDLNIKAVHTVPSNSIGLIGHEIGENEKAIYKRSLDYEVGININGTIDKPIVSFSLDLPQQEKTNYPVLANKLERLRQPEFQSELNKQVFGLLVLGGFLPESSGSDINSSQIATTALSNSVNSLLAGQLNRFASQYIKGVNIDVGIQSYSDYSAPGGKTQTAMDFRVSKRIMDDRLSFEIGGDFDINMDQSGANKGTKNYRGDVAIVYDLTGNGDKQLKLFNNETYDIVYQEIRNTGISIIFIREFSRDEKKKRRKK